MKKAVLLTLNNCKMCPFCDTKLTKGFGHALDYFCKKANNRTIAGYVEWSSEAPQDGKIPEWCPLPEISEKK